MSEFLHLSAIPPAQHTNLTASTSFFSPLCRYLKPSFQLSLSFLFLLFPVPSLSLSLYPFVGDCWS